MREGVESPVAKQAESEAEELAVNVEEIAAENEIEELVTSEIEEVGEKRDEESAITEMEQSIGSIVDEIIDEPIKIIRKLL